jgi:hypothetical protein
VKFLLVLEPIGNQFPTCRDGNEGRYQKKSDDHLNNAEVYGIASNKPPGDYGGNDHDRANDQIQHAGDSADMIDIFEKSLPQLLAAQFDACQQTPALQG